MLFVCDWKKTANILHGVVETTYKANFFISVAYYAVIWTIIATL